MALATDINKWKKKGPSKARIGVSAIVSTPALKIEDKDSLMGNSNLSGGHAKQPKQGRRM